MNKRIFLECMFSFLLSLLVIIPVVYLSLYFIQPPQDWAENVRHLFVVDVSAFNPEPGERIAFWLAVIFFPLASLLTINMSAYLFRRWNFSLFTQHVLVIALFVLLSFYFYFGIAAADFEYLKISRNAFYLSPILILSLIPIGILLFLVARYSWINSVAKIFSLLIFASVILLLFGFHLLRLDTIFDFHHFNAVFFAMSQVLAGKVILSDFLHQYGLYPHFIAPLVSLFGERVFGFTLIMASLVVFAYSFLFFTLLAAVKNKAVVILGFLSVIAFNFLAPNYHNPYPYYQYFPIRIIFPMLAIFLAWKLVNKNSSVLKWFGFFIGALSLLWNLDTGFVVLLAWFVFVAFLDLSNWQKIGLRESLKDVFKTLVVGSIILFFVVALYGFCIFLLFGKVPDFSLMTEYQRIFYLYGFFMVKMPLFNVWNSAIFVYLFSLVFVLHGLISGKITALQKILFFLSLLGIGLFTYYQGRSLPMVFNGVWYPALIIMVIVFDRIIDSIKYFSFSFLNFVSLLVLFFILGSGAVSAVTNSQLVLNYDKIKSQIFSAPDYQKGHVIEANFIDEHSNEGEEVLVLSSYAGIYHDFSRTSSALKSPQFIEMMLKKDYLNVLVAIKEKKLNKIFLDAEASSPYFSPELRSELFNKYRTVAISRTKRMAYLLPKAEGEKDFSVDNIFHFKLQNNVVFHAALFFDQFRFLKRDSLEWHNLPFHFPAINLGKDFTIELLLKPEKRIDPAYSTIISNHPGFANESPAGFVFHQNGLENNVYHFGYGTLTGWTKPGIGLYLAPEEWHYVVIVVKNEEIKIYRNGSLVLTEKVDGKIKNTNMPLVLGNWYDGTRLFSGLIKEVQIMDSEITESDIQINWQNILFKNKLLK